MKSLMIFETVSVTNSQIVVSSSAKISLIGISVALDGSIGSSMKASILYDRIHCRAKNFKNAFVGQWQCAQWNHYALHHIPFSDLNALIIPDQFYSFWFL